MRKYGVILLFLTLGCETYFEPKIDKNEQAVVNAFFRPEAPFTVNLTTSNFITAPENVNPLLGATVEVSSSEGFSEILTYTGNGNYVGQRIVDTERMFSLNIVADGYPVLTANDTIPDKILATEFVIDPNLKAVNLEDVGYPAMITFNDPPNVANYYGLEVIVLDVRDPANDGNVFAGDVGEVFFEDTEVNVIQNVDIDIGDFNNIEAFPTLYFDDLAFTTEEVQMEFFISPENLAPEDFANYEIYVVLKSLSRSYFEYLRTTSFQKKIIEQGLPADPVQIDSNIENGLGVFGGYDFSIVKGAVVE